MKTPRFDEVRVGQALPGVVSAPITRPVLQAYAQASGDDNPLHLDADYARRAGLPDVLAHGMLSAAYLARVLTHWVAQPAIRSLSLRFVAMTPLQDALHCRAVVVDKQQGQGERLVQLALSACNPQGEPRITGSAWVALP